MGSQQPRPQLGATFTPGGSDDFYMPEVISPAPQRVMPEVPDNMQQNLDHLETEATGQRSNRNEYPGRTDSLMFSTPPASQDGSHGPESTRTYSHHGHAGMSGYNEDDGSVTYAFPDQPSFSPFPQLRNPPPNVPPSDEEKEVTLEQARIPVLNSNDPEMQLAWAQDALAYVEVAMQNEARLSEYQPPRPHTPQVEHQLRMDAVNIVSFLADQHHPKAEFMRGMWLEFGKFGFRIDRKEAFKCYARAAEKGYARAEYRMGMQFESSNDPVKAIRHYNRGVAAGDSASNYRLGMMVLLGQHGQPQDYVRGLELIRFAAETADENAPQGAYVYGMLQARELENITIPEVFLPLDINGARLNIEKAAYLGFAKAQVKMGSAYELCQLGCDFNPALSLHYNALAARQGEPVAEMAISKWFLCGYEGIFEKNEEMAYTYALRAARSGLPTAEFAMGYFNEIGMYVSANMQEARRWYEKAAAHGNKDAAGRIDGISRSKTLSKKDHEDVAIQRIRSQYGSQRGKRPQRFRPTTDTMPSIPDDRVDMPDPQKDNRFLQSQNGHASRSQSAMGAPYPLEDGPQRGASRPGTATGFVGPRVRPGSAFGGSPQMRPVNSNVSDNAQYPGAAHPVPAGSGYGASYGADTAGRHRPISSNYRAPASSGYGGLPMGDIPEAKTNKPVSPRLDIGYSAPQDRPYQGQQRHDSRPQQPIVNPDYEVGQMSESQRPARMSSIPPGQAFGTNARPGSTQLPSAYSGSTRPARTPRPEPLEPPHLPGSGPSSPTTSRPGKTPLHPDAIAPRPPGKGPKTFEEMGVPQASKESECSVM